MVFIAHVSFGISNSGNFIDCIRHNIYSVESAIFILSCVLSSIHDVINAMMSNERKKNSKNCAPVSHVINIIGNSRALQRRQHYAHFTKFKRLFHLHIQRIFVISFSCADVALVYALSCSSFELAHACVREQIK